MAQADDQWKQAARRISRIVFPHVLNCQQLISASAGKNDLSSDEPSGHRNTVGILERFIPSADVIASGTLTRRAISRASDSGTTSTGIRLSAENALVEPPQTLEELYNVTLPRLRAQLRQQGLRQVGRIKPVDEETFSRLKYAAAAGGASAGAATGYDPMHPAAITDPTLRLFEPRMWTAPAPPDADPLPYIPQQKIRSAFRIAPQTVHRGETVEYELTVHADVDVAQLRLSVTLAQLSPARPISRMERLIGPIAAGSRHCVRSSVRLNTQYMPAGAYTVSAALILLLPQTYTQRTDTQTPGVLELPLTVFEPQRIDLVE
uniref:Gsp-co-occurring protein 9 n=1 Tax=Malawimonas jakobiformis TaxID=136089 RepID=A0A895KR63_MALJA|nr:Gsp-co-occurring protein 9 [Malawimonas jakobiformis]